MNRTDGELDAAVLAYRADATEANRRRLLVAQEAHNTAFMHEQTIEYIGRTSGVLAP